MPLVAHDLTDPEAIAFCRERLAAISNTLETWPRVACRRARECKGSSETLPRCMPIVTGVIRICVSACVSTIPELAPRPASTEPTFNERLHLLMHRSTGILEHHIETMEKGIEKRRN